MHVFGLSNDFVDRCRAEPGDRGDELVDQLRRRRGAGGDADPAVAGQPGQRHLGRRPRPGARRRRRGRPPRPAAPSWTSSPSRRRAAGRSRRRWLADGLLPVGGGVADVVAARTGQRREPLDAARPRSPRPRRRRAWSAWRRRPGPGESTSAAAASCTSPITLIRVGRLADGALDLLVALVADQEHGVAAGRVPAHLGVHLRHQRAGGVDDPQACGPPPAARTGGRHAVRGQHQHAARRHLVGLLHEHRTALLQVGDDVRVVHDLRGARRPARRTDPAPGRRCRWPARHRRRTTAGWRAPSSCVPTVAAQASRAGTARRRVRSARTPRPTMPGCQSGASSVSVMTRTTANGSRRGGASQADSMSTASTPSARSFGAGGRGEACAGTRSGPGGRSGRAAANRRRAAEPTGRRPRCRRRRGPRSPPPRRRARPAARCRRRRRPPGWVALERGGGPRDLATPCRYARTSAPAVASARFSTRSGAAITGTVTLVTVSRLTVARAAIRGRARSGPAP